MQTPEIVTQRSKQSVDKHLFRLSSIPELKVLGRDNFLQDMFGSAATIELAPRLEKVQKGDLITEADNFFAAFDAGVEYSMKEWHTHYPEDVNLAFNQFTQDGKASPEDQVAYMAGYAAFRLTQGDTMFGIRAIEQIAKIKQVKPRDLLAKTYIAPLTRATRGLTALKDTEEFRDGTITLDALGPPIDYLRDEYRINWDQVAQEFYEVQDGKRVTLSSSPLPIKTPA